MARMLFLPVSLGLSLSFSGVFFGGLISGAVIVPQSYASEKGSAMAGRVVSVNGKVLIRKDTGNAEAPNDGARLLKPGDSISKGDVINTPSDGEVKLLLSDRSIVDIGPSALFKLEEYKKNSGADRQVAVSLPYGRVRASVTQKLRDEGKFTIRTASATMGVRGTEFVVSSTLGDPSASNGPNSSSPKNAAPKTEVVVLQGRVDVAKQPAAGAPAGPATRAPKVLSLTAGQKTLATSAPQAVLSKVTLSADQIKKVVQTATVQDRTFSKAISLDVPQTDDSAGRGPASAGSRALSGNVTYAALSNVIENSVTEGGLAAPAVVADSMGKGGFVGVSAPEDALRPPPVNLIPGGMARVRVIVK